MRSFVSSAVVCLCCACPGPSSSDGGTGGGAGGGTATFDSGFVHILPAGMTGQAYAVVPTGAGDDVFVVGNGTSDGGSPALLVARVKTDRTLERTWGTEGLAVADVADGMSVGIGSFSTDTGYAAFLDPDTRELFVTGVAQALQVPGQGSKVLLAKFRPNGTLDTSFGNTGATTGIRLDGFTGTSASATAILKQPDGKLLIGGDVQSNFFVTRYLPNGTADTTFSKTPGMGFGAAWGTSRAEGTRSMVLEPDGKIVVFGGASMSAARLLSDGQLDTSFGSAGFFSSGNATGAALWRKPDGSYLAVGSDEVVTDGGTQFAVRFLEISSAGVAEPSGGRTIVMPAGPGLSSIRGAARLADGRVVLYLTGLGTTYLARFNADLTLDATFLEGGSLKQLSVKLPLLQPAFMEGQHLAVIGDRFWIADITNVVVDPKAPATKNFFEVVTGAL